VLWCVESRGDFFNPVQKFVPTGIKTRDLGGATQELYPYDKGPFAFENMSLVIIHTWSSLNLTLLS
jgi:hypothetical protein